MNDDRGASEAVAMIAMAPVVVAFVVLVFFLGRQVDSRAAVRSAAEAAAQSAALQRTPVEAAEAAHRTATDALADVDICAGGPVVEVDLSGFRPGGVVTVTATCMTDDSDLGSLAPPSRTFTGSGSAVIDVFRAGASS